MNEFGALMEAAQNGDKVAYAGLLCEIVPLLQRRVRSKAPFLQSADREDVVQDVLLSLHATCTSRVSRRERSRPTNCSLRAWNDAAIG